MATLWIDGRTYKVDERHNLLQAVLSLGLDLPYFCWHPALGSVGACRQCAVVQYRDEKDTRGKLTMACMTPAKDGTRISIGAADAVEFRARVIEWLMVNHPHDCPVCDEGGECHLQDMTLMTGHRRREYRFTKRTHRNQDLGPFINHEMNRCIACYRCVRYYRDYAGGHDLQAFAAHDHVYFGRAQDGTLESEFSGNLVEVCPTGVFTDKTLQEHYTRKWDLMSAPSVCNHCGVGCNTLAGERYGMLRRILNRYNSQVNGYFLCDRGRFGYEFVNGPDRLRQPQLRQAGGEPVPVDSVSALASAATLLRGGKKMIGIGSPRATLEANYMLRNLVGEENFSTGMTDREHALVGTVVKILRETPARPASLQDVRESDAVLILGEDLTNTAPVMALAVRHAARNVPVAVASKLGIPDWNDAAIRQVVQDATGPVFIAAPMATRLDDVAAAVYRGAPAALIDLGASIAVGITAGAGQPPGPPDETGTLAVRIAGALKGASRPLVIAGTSLLEEGLLQAAAEIAAALAAAGKDARLALTVPDCNSLGVSLLGGKGIEEIFARTSGGGMAAVILENDLYRRLPEAQAEEFLGRCHGVIVLDAIAHATAARAQVSLPAGSFAEGDGTLINYEGRAQRFFQVLAPKEGMHESWRWLQQLTVAVSPAGREAGMTFDDIAAAACNAIPELRGKTDEIAPPSTFRVRGLKVARQTHRASGRTAMSANRTMFEPPPPPDPDSPLKFSMEGVHFEADPALIPYFWAPGWNSVQATVWYQQEVGGPLRGGDPGVRLFPGNSASRPSSPGTPGGEHGSRDRGEDDGSYTLVPLHHIFGSEELSSLAGGIASRAPQPHAAVNSRTAAQLGAAEGATLLVPVGEGFAAFPALIRDDLADGVVGIMTGRAGASSVPFGSRVAVKAEVRS